MGVQVIGSGGQQVTAVGVPTKRVNAAAVRIVGAGAGGAGGDHNDTTNRDAADAHPISAITGLQDALDAVAGGGSNLRVDVAIGDGNSDIDLDGAAPGDLPAVLVWGRASGNGVYTSTQRHSPDSTSASSHRDRRSIPSQSLTSISAHAPTKRAAHARTRARRIAMGLILARSPVGGRRCRDEQLRRRTRPARAPRPSEPHAFQCEHIHDVP